MGTSYTFNGSINMEPPLNFAQLQKAKRVAMDLLREGFDRKHATTETVFEGYMPLKPELVSEERETPEGVLNVIQATALVPSHPQTGSLKYDMKDLVSRLAFAFPETAFYGEITALRECGTKAVRLIAQGKGKNAIEQSSGTAYIHWDDDSDRTPVADLL